MKIINLSEDTYNINLRYMSKVTNVCLVLIKRVVWNTTVFFDLELGLKNRRNITNIEFKTVNNIIYQESCIKLHNLTLHMLIDDIMIKYKFVQMLL